MIQNAQKEEKENNKYFRILEAGTIKQTKIFKISKKCTLEDQENFSNLNSATKNLIKGINTPKKRFFNILKIYERGTQTDRPKNKKDDGYKQNFTPEW